MNLTINIPNLRPSRLVRKLEDGVSAVGHHVARGARAVRNEYRARQLAAMSADILKQADAISRMSPGERAAFEIEQQHVAARVNELLAKRKR